ISGSVSGSVHGNLWQLMHSHAITLGLTLCVVRPLAALALGETMAINLGHKPGRVRLLAVLIVALLVGAATALAGPIVFVGLVVSFIARALAGADIRRYLVLCLFIGHIFLLNVVILEYVLVSRC